jgi:hypothetical protein
LIPDSRVLTLKLTYYEDATPPNYEPEFFSKLADIDMLKFNGDVLRIKIGKLTTQDHSLQVRFAHVEECIFEDTLDSKVMPFLATSMSDQTLASEIDALNIKNDKTLNVTAKVVSPTTTKKFMYSKYCIHRSY